MADRTVLTLRAQVDAFSVGGYGLWTAAYWEKPAMACFADVRDAASTRRFARGYNRQRRHSSKGPEGYGRTVPWSLGTGNCETRVA